VTDADLALGRIPVDAAFPGLGRLDVTAARRALARAGVDAAAVIAVVEAAMEQAIRAVTVERGVDPRRLVLVAFGGAGPLHACALADALEMRAVVVPPRAGVLSAVGLLCSPRQVDLVRSWPTPTSHDGLGEALAALAEHARVAKSVSVETAVDCRFVGQSHELTVPTVGEFEAEHVRRNGYARPGTPVEVIALRATGRAAPAIDYEALPPPALRAPATGPAVLVEPDCTVWVAAGWRADVVGGGAWALTRVLTR
jgi:N-methylhydantoinase A/oxoprolinase/acetone carboxylase beta subunit